MVDSSVVQHIADPPAEPDFCAGGMHARDSWVELAGLDLDAFHNNSDCPFNPAGPDHFIRLTRISCVQRRALHVAAAAEASTKRAIPGELSSEFCLYKIFPRREVAYAVARADISQTEGKNPSIFFIRLAVGYLDERDDVA